VTVPRIGIRMGVGAVFVPGVAGPARPAVRHLARAVGETVGMHRVSDRAERRARAQGEWAA
jgi:hypothetical protein